jgi:hypothetical protein
MRDLFEQKNKANEQRPFKDTPFNTRQGLLSRLIERQWLAKPSVKPPPEHLSYFSKNVPHRFIHPGRAPRVILF